MPLASKTTLRALENNYLDQSPWYAPPRSLSLADSGDQERSTRLLFKIQDATLATTKLSKTSSSRRSRRIARLPLLSARQQNLAVTREPGAEQSPCRLAGPAGGQGLHPASDESTGCGATLAEECGRWPPNDLCSPFAPRWAFRPSGKQVILLIVCRPSRGFKNPFFRLGSGQILAQSIIHLCAVWDRSLGPLFGTVTVTVSSPNSAELSGPYSAFVFRLALAGASVSQGILDPSGLISHRGPDGTFSRRREGGF